MSNLPTNRQTLQQNPYASPDSVDWLFAKLLTMFGRQWADMWSGIPAETVKADWRHALASYDVDTMRLAIESMQRDGRDYPPNQTQFVALCRQLARRGPHLLAIADNRRSPPPHGFQALRDIIDAAGRK